MINILLIGGTGFIGSNLLEKLALDKSFNCFVIEPKSRKQLIENNRYNSNAKYFHGQISDIDMIEEIIRNEKIMIIMHLVSNLLPNSCFDDYINEITSVNIPTLRLLKICSQKKIKFIYFSSGGAIYGNSNKSVHKETDKTKPISYYGMSKLHLEEEIKFENRINKLDYIIIRPSNPFGKGQDLYGKQGIISVIIGKVIKDEPIVIWGDGNNIRDYIHITDLVDFVYILIKKNVRNKVINIGSSVGLSLNDLLKHISSICNRDIKVIYEHKRTEDVSSIILNTRLLQSITKKKTRDFNESLKEYINQVFNRIL